MKSLMKSLIEGKTLSMGEAHALMDALLSDQLRPEQIGFMLACFEFRAPTGKELAGFAEALLKRSISLDPSSENLIDVCGTGGDGLGMFNVSTCVAFVVAGAGLKVAKHGNRAVSSRCGSFDVLEALGIPVAQNIQEAESALETDGLAFLFAPSFHPILGVLAPIRRNLAVRTILNALGPLLNPARVRRQLIGVYSPRLLAPMAEALQLLGAEEAMIVHGDDGSDEISLLTSTKVAHLKNGEISHYTITPHELGLGEADSEDLVGGEAEENAQILKAILSGEKGSHRDITLLNAGAALYIGNKASSLKEGLILAAKSIDSGAALSVLENKQRQNLVKAMA